MQVTLHFGGENQALKNMQKEEWYQKKEEEFISTLKGAEQDFNKFLKDNLIENLKKYYENELKKKDDEITKIKNEIMSYIERKKEKINLKKEMKKKKKKKRVLERENEEKMTPNSPICLVDQKLSNLASMSDSFYELIQQLDVKDLSVQELQTFLRQSKYELKFLRAENSRIQRELDLLQEKSIFLETSNEGIQNNICKEREPLSPTKLQGISNLSRNLISTGKSHLDEIQIADTVGKLLEMKRIKLVLQEYISFHTDDVRRFIEDVSKLREQTDSRSGFDDDIYDLEIQDLQNLNSSISKIRSSLVTKQKSMDMIFLSLVNQFHSIYLSNSYIRFTVNAPPFNVGDCVIYAKDSVMQNCFEESVQDIDQFTKSSYYIGDCDGTIEIVSPGKLNGNICNHLARLQCYDSDHEDEYTDSEEFKKKGKAVFMERDMNETCSILEKDLSFSRSPSLQKTGPYSSFNYSKSNLQMEVSEKLMKGVCKKGAFSIPKEECTPLANN